MHQFHVQFCLAFVVLVQVACGGALAQENAGKTGEELKSLRQKIEQAGKREKQITTELTAIEREAREISARLINLAAKTQVQESKITAGERKIAALNETRRELTTRLHSRRIALGELLVGLQRLERNPPPPLVAHPGDALAAIRSATLFRAIIPAIKTETTSIRRDLSRLKNVQASLLAAQKDLKKNIASHDNVRSQLNDLLARKRAFAQKTRKELEDERKRTRRLAARAKNLKQLLARLAIEKSRADKQKSLEAKRAAAARRVRLLKPKLVFSKAIGSLSLPANGLIVRRFKQKNKLGRPSNGLYLATRGKAQVIAPASGVVEFAGRFRSYGQLLILNVGEGYRMLLGGLGRIDVTTGQEVLAGEPIGTMGDKADRRTLITAALDVKDPVLYIEFRKNGGSINPAPWWDLNQKEVHN